jgi:EAL domain-containing protein (putative c-di-GMP-specific phosphodiesterase class I)
VESLVRWRHPTRGLLVPDLFIPLAEETGLIVPLGVRILDQVVRMAASLQHRLPAGGVALNVSARQLVGPAFDADVVAALEEYGLPARMLTIEITETALMEEFGTANIALSQLVKRGMPLVLDDFGCGYSSISRLSEFPVTGMKIDKSLCADLGTDRHRDNVVRSIVDLAHALGLSVVMEGIESPLAATTSRDLGADFGQGHYFARPMRQEDLAAALAKAPAF